MLDAQGRRVFIVRAIPINERPPPANAQQKSMSFDQVGDAYLFEQTYGVPPSDTPELNLRRAMFLQAWNDLHYPHRYPGISIIERLILKAWVNGCFESGEPYTSQPGFSFEEVCGALGLEPDLARKAIYEREPPAQNAIREVIVGDMMRVKSPLHRRAKLAHKQYREDRRADSSRVVRGRTSQTAR